MTLKQRNSITSDKRNRERANLAAVEQCLSAAFPQSFLQTPVSSEGNKHLFTLKADGKERTLTVLHSALLGTDLHRHLQDIPEALNTAAAVVLTAQGLTLGDREDKGDDRTADLSLAAQGVEMRIASALNLLRSTLHADVYEDVLSMLRAEYNQICSEIARIDAAGYAAALLKAQARVLQAGLEGAECLCHRKRL